MVTPTASPYSDTAVVGLTTYSYRVRATDAAGNLSGYSTTATAVTGTGGGTYTYDANGHLSTVTIPRGATMHYYYDAAGNLTSVQKTIP